jgi:TATA-box binding protein (TBP) (component of TFIID and TFIIIB)
MSNNNDSVGDKSRQDDIDHDLAGFLDNMFNDFDLDINIDLDVDFDDEHINSNSNAVIDKVSESRIIDNCNHGNIKTDEINGEYEDDENGKEEQFDNCVPQKKTDVHLSIEDVFASAKHYDALLETALRDIALHNASVPMLEANEINIATMTIMGHLSHDHINLLKVVRHFERSDVKQLLCDRGVVFTDLVHPKSMITHVNSKKKKKKTFQNSIILKYSEKKPGLNRKAIKIFCNGALHVNGCKRVEEFIGVCRIVCDVLNFIYKREQQDASQMFNLGKFDVQLINTNLVVNHKLNLSAVSDFLEMEADDNIQVDYDVSFHPAVNVKNSVNRRDVTILIFNSGSIIITGVVTAHELVESYKFVTSFLHRHLDNVVSVNDGIEKTYPDDEDDKSAAFLKNGRKKRKQPTKGVDNSHGEFFEECVSEDESRKLEQGKKKTGGRKKRVKVSRTRGMTMYR